VQLIAHLGVGVSSAATGTFLFVYMGAALVQVAILLCVCEPLIHRLWSAGIDPDNASIPYLTAFGDLLGGAFLASVFWALDP